MTRTSAGLLAVVVLIAPGASPLSAQQPANPDVVRETARVTVVEVPVNVVGKDGRPVAGLTAADFELYDDGKKQTISGFDAVDLSAPRPAAETAASSVSPAARRHWLLVFDLSYTSLTGLLRARDGAEAFVRRAMKDSDLAAVATLSVEKGWNLLANFSADRNQLTSAIRTLGLPGLTARSSDPLGLLFTAPTEATQTSFSNNPKNSMLEDFKELQQTLQKPANDAQARGKVAGLLRSLAGMGHVLDSVRGRKHVLFFSEGFETRHLVGSTPMSGTTGTNVFDRTAPTNEAANSAISGEVWKVDSDARFGSTSSRSVLTQALAEFRRSDTVLDTIDISGLRAEGDVAAATKPGSGSDALYTMASETEGDFIRNANQLGGEIEKLVERTSLVYVLAFQATPSGKPGAFHQLKVKVRASGARILARAGYYEPRPYVALSPLERILASGDLVTGGARENSLATDLLCVVMPSEGGSARVPLVLEIAGAPLLAASAAAGRTVQIYAYAVNASGTLADYLSQEMTLDLARVRGSLESGGIKFYGALTLPPGDYTIRTLVRDAASGRAAVSAAPVRVPSAGGPALVLPPFFPDRSGRWLFVRAATRPEAAARAPEYAFSVEGESFVPALRPILTRPGPPVEATVLTYGFGPGGAASPLQVAAEIVGAGGKPQPAEVTVLKRIDGEKSGARALTLAFAPEKLEPGRYSLKVRVSDRATRQSAEASTGFEVR